MIVLFFFVSCYVIDSSAHKGGSLGEVLRTAQHAHGVPGPGCRVLHPAFRALSRGGRHRKTAVGKQLALGAPSGIIVFTVATGARRVIPWPFGDGQVPLWSPDGSWGCESHDFALHMVRPDGSDQRRLRPRGLVFRLCQRRRQGFLRLTPASTVYPTRNWFKV